MFSSQKPIFNRTLPHKKFVRLIDLWQQMRDFCGAEAELIGEDNLFLQENKAIAAKKRFRLLISRHFSALLSGSPLPEKSDYQVTISFSPQTIAEFLHYLPRPLLKYSQLENYRKRLLAQIKPNIKDRDRFMAELLEIIGPDRGKTIYRLSGCRSRDPLEAILNRQVEQENILDRLALQIDRNLDLLAIIKMTVQQVRDLLDLDRLIIYQLNVETENKQKVDRVTYEALAHSGIASTLNLQDDRCFARNSRSGRKYLEGFNLIVDNIDTDTDLNPCLREFMQQLGVKSKLVIPIIVKKQLWGFTIAHQCSKPSPWKQKDIKFLQRVAEYLAIAIYQDLFYRQAQEQKNNLQQQIDRRARELQDALIAAQAAHNSKTAFLGNMSHELRTPLTCIIGLSGTLLHWSQDNYALPLDKQRQYLQTIHDSGKNLLELVNDILEFSQVEAGKSSLNISQFSLRYLSRAILQNFQEKADRKQISLQLDWRVNPSQDRFCGDRERVEQIVFHLLDNAIKFTPESGKVTLRIWRDKKQAVFQIEDTGIGISENQLPLLFEKFQQIEEYRQRIYGGTGLGLALTKQLIELHGGRVEVDSCPGKGSLFTVWLPDKSDSLTSIPATNVSVPSSFNKGTVVLLAENEAEATLICELLTAADYQIVWLINGGSSIRQIELLQPISILIDRRLPEFETTIKTLKNLNTTADIKVVLIAQENISPQQWNYLSQIGIADYLIEPIQPDILLKKISHVVSEDKIPQIASTEMGESF
ncbi:MAG: ATP-binding protein [Prochloraceae cyanobacterium]